MNQNLSFEDEFSQYQISSIETDQFFWFWLSERHQVLQILSLLLVVVVSVFVNENGQDWLTDFCGIEHFLLGFGRAVLVLSLDPNTNICLVGKKFTLDNRTPTGSTDHMRLPGRQDKTSGVKQFQKVSPTVSSLLSSKLWSCQMTKTRNIFGCIYSLFAGSQCRL